MRVQLTGWGEGAKTKATLEQGETAKVEKAGLAKGESEVTLQLPCQQAGQGGPSKGRH